MIDFALNMSIIKSNVALIELGWALQVLGLCLLDAGDQAPVLVYSN